MFSLSLCCHAFPEARLGASVLLLYQKGQSPHALTVCLLVRCISPLRSPPLFWPWPVMRNRCHVSNHRNLEPRCTNCPKCRVPPRPRALNVNFHFPDSKFIFGFSYDFFNRCRS